MTRAKSLLEVKDGAHLPRHHRPRRCSALRGSATGARLPLVLMNSLRHARGLAGGARRHAGSRPTCRSTSCRTRSRSCAPTTCGPRVARRPGPRVGAARARRPLHGAAGLGHARRAARARLPLRVRVERRQPRRGAGAARSSPGWRARACPFADGGRRPHGGRPQGRPPRAPPPTAGWCCARSRRPPRRTSTPSRTSTRHRYFNTNNLWVDLEALRRVLEPARRRARAADDRQPQDASTRRTRRRPPVIQLETAMGAAIDVVRRARGRCASRARASCRSRRPTTCSCCARTPTCSTSGARVVLAPERAGPRAARRSRRATTSS